MDEPDQTWNHSHTTTLLPRKGGCVAQKGCCSLVSDCTNVAFGIHGGIRTKKWLSSLPCGVLLPAEICVGCGVWGVCPERLEPSDSSTPCRYQADSLLSRMSSCPISHRSWCIEPSWQLRVTRNEGSIPEREPEKWLPQLRLAAGAQIAQSQSPG